MNDAVYLTNAAVAVEGAIIGEFERVSYESREFSTESRDESAFQRTTSMYFGSYICRWIGFVQLLLQ